jgi:GH24 family phage-related lysozyme (muramidase)
MSVMPGNDDLIKHLKESEGDSSHLYLDTKGFPTVGVGFKLNNIQEAKNLGFMDPITKKFATKLEIVNEFESITRQKRGMLSSKYKFNLVLPREYRDKLLEEKIESFKKELKHKFISYDKYPVPVQNALLDMAFNLGTTGLVTKFPKFKKAVESEDWGTAAKESNRPDVNAKRNLTVKNWFLEAEKMKSNR